MIFVDILDSYNQRIASDSDSVIQVSSISEMGIFFSSLVAR